MQIAAVYRLINRVVRIKWQFLFSLAVGLFALWTWNNCAYLPFGFTLLCDALHGNRFVIKKKTDVAFWPRANYGMHAIRHCR